MIKTKRKNKPTNILMVVLGLYFLIAGAVGSIGSHFEQSGSSLEFLGPYYFVVRILLAPFFIFQSILAMVGTAFGLAIFPIGDYLAGATSIGLGLLLLLSNLQK